MRSELAELRHRVGTEEHQKLDAHLDALRRVENGLSGQATIDRRLRAPAEPMQVDCNAHENFAAITRSQTDLLVSALGCGHDARCDLAALAHGRAARVLVARLERWPPHALALGRRQYDRRRQYVTAERWIAEQFGYLLTQLDSMPEPMGDGTMLDHTLVVWAKELADGRLHNCESVPFVLAGAKRYLNAGRYLKLGGEPHQKLLISICNALGVEAETFGTPTLGRGRSRG